jgi:hypothetical protein
LRAIRKFHEEVAQNNELTIENEFVDAYVASELAKYDLEKDKKIERIQERISLGYEKFVSIYFIFFY